MSKEKIEEIKEFVNDFNLKLKESFKLYEAKNTNRKKLKKNFSQINSEIKMKNKLGSLTSRINEENKKNSLQKYQLINKHIIWKPPNGAPNYFEKFKSLHSEHELSIWEKVSKHIIIFNKKFSKE